MSEPYWSALGGGVVDYEGAWNPATAYAPGDVVRHGGVDYLAVNPSTGVQPSPVVPAPASKGIGFPLDRVGLLTPPAAQSDEFDAALAAKWGAGVGAAMQTIQSAGPLAPEGLLLARTDAAGGQLSGLLQNITPPCSIFAKLGGSQPDGTNTRRGGILLSVANPTAASAVIYNGSFSGAAGTRAMNGIRYNNFSSFAANLGALPFPNGAVPLWMWVQLLAGGTSYNAWGSVDGHMWLLQEMARPTTFTVGSAGLGFNTEGAGAGSIAFDFFRVVPE